MKKMNKDEMLEEALEKLEAEREKVIRCHRTKEILQAELTNRDKLILKIKEYVGADNFRAMLQIFGEVEAK